MSKRLDARRKINGQCGKGWTEGPQGKCIRPKGSQEPEYGADDSPYKKRLKKLAFGLGADEYNRQRSAGVDRGQAASAAQERRAEGFIQDQVFGAGLGGVANIGGRIGGSVYRRSRNVGQSRLKAGAKGLGIGVGTNLLVSTAAKKGLEYLEKKAREKYESKQQAERHGDKPLSRGFQKKKITKEDLEKSRRKARIKNHPDRSPDPAERERRTKKLQDIEAAYFKVARRSGIKLDSLLKRLRLGSKDELRSAARNRRFDASKKAQCKKGVPCGAVCISKGETCNQGSYGAKTARYNQEFMGASFMGLVKPDGTADISSFRKLPKNRQRQALRQAYEFNEQMNWDSIHETRGDSMDWDLIAEEIELSHGIAVDGIYRVDSYTDGSIAGIGVSGNGFFEFDIDESSVGVTPRYDLTDAADERSRGALAAKGLDYRGDSAFAYMRGMEVRMDAPMGDGKCGKGWKPGPGGKCVRAKGMAGKIAAGVAATAALGGAAYLGRRQIANQYLRLRSGGLASDVKAGARNAARQVRRAVNNPGAAAQQVGNAARSAAGQGVNAAKGAAQKVRGAATYGANVAMAAAQNPRAAAKAAGQAAQGAARRGASAARGAAQQVGNAARSAAGQGVNAAKGAAQKVRGAATYGANVAMAAAQNPRAAAKAAGRAAQGAAQRGASAARGAAQQVKNAAQNPGATARSAARSARSAAGSAMRSVDRAALRTVEAGQYYNSVKADLKARARDARTAQAQQRLARRKPKA